MADDSPYTGLLYSFTIVGNRLFAYDYINGPVLNPVWIYNFDRQNNNYSLLGSTTQTEGASYSNVGIAVSPDGNLLFVPSEESISIFDVNQIVNGKPGLITNLASYHGPAVMAVSPVAGGDLVGRLVERSLRRDQGTQPVEEGSPNPVVGAEPRGDIDFQRQPNRERPVRPAPESSVVSGAGSIEGQSGGGQRFAETGLGEDANRNRE